MFDVKLPSLAELGRYDDAALVDAMKDAARLEAATMARRLAAAARLYHLRDAGHESDDNWCIDNWELVAAEVAAAQGISRGRGSWQLEYGLALMDRLPQLGAVFAAGDVDFRVISAVVFRTGLIMDDEALARIDGWLARKAPRWNKLSREKITEIVDWRVQELDPAAVRVARARDDERHINIGPSESGMAEIWGNVRAPDAAALDRRLDQLAATVCPDDPRTKVQRRADALAALAARATAMPCSCGSPDCPAGSADATLGDVVIHVLADEATIRGQSSTPGYVPGYGGLPAETVRQMAKSAKLRPVIHPKDCPPEPGYRPSAALADFVRCRDLTCRFPGCDRPAELADIDHTIPYPGGPTHASNLKLLCRLHHLLKTFCTGPKGWADRQLPDGTVIWTSPSGHTYTTKPGGSLFFPQLAIPTGKLVRAAATSPPDAIRSVMMPTRRRTRTQDRAYRLQYERGVNEARLAANFEPPPF